VLGGASRAKRARGSALNLNVHFHTLVLDGVYELVDGAPTRFVPLPPPDASEVARVLAGTARRISRVLEARGDGDDDALAHDEPLLATLAAASLRTRIATGPQAGARWRRLERLCCYVARPPPASDRLEERPDGRLALRLKTRWRDGTTHMLMERHELLDRLVPLIPPPRAHQVRYQGVLAPCSSVRDRIVPGPCGELGASLPKDPSSALSVARAVPEAAEHVQTPSSRAPAGARGGWHPRPGASGGRLAFRSVTRP
jgi:hypothetical protein